VESELTEAIHDLRGGGAAIVLSHSPMTADERAQFRTTKGVEPLRVAVCGGTSHLHQDTDDIVVLVNEKNPLATISLAELDAIFSSTLYRLGRRARLWGELGLPPPWADRHIQVCGFDAGSMMGRTVVERVLLEGLVRPSRYSSEGVADTVARNPLAIGFAADSVIAPGVKCLAVQLEDGDDYVLPSSSRGGASAEYPLARIGYLYSMPSGGMGGGVPDFIRFVLSDRGQRIVEENSPFRMLSPIVVGRERLRLNDWQVESRRSQAGSHQVRIPKRINPVDAHVLRNRTLLQSKQPQGAR
jgi:phosphate transport system substrate-binding protein